MTKTHSTTRTTEALGAPDTKRNAAPLCAHCHNGNHEMMGPDTTACSCPCHGRPR